MIIVMIVNLLRFVAVLPDRGQHRIVLGYMRGVKNYTF